MDSVGVGVPTSSESGFSCVGAGLGSGVIAASRVGVQLGVGLIFSTAAGEQADRNRNKLVSNNWRLRMAQLYR